VQGEAVQRTAKPQYLTKGAAVLRPCCCLLYNSFW